MTERPILFSGEMVRAILDGRKTVTRRLVKGIALDWLAPGMFTPEVVAMPENYLCPYGFAGDRLWCRETHALNVPGCERGISYRADHRDPLGDGPARPMKWRPSIHMPRWASRLSLEVVSVRAERLQDITEGDAIAEGWPKVGDPGSDTGGNGGPFDWFRGLWDEINGERASWEINPWVWRIEFAKLEGGAA